jgi:hypothetical protein
MLSGVANESTRQFLQRLMQAFDSWIAAQTPPASTS